MVVAMIPRGRRLCLELADGRTVYFHDKPDQVTWETFDRDEEAFVPLDAPPTLTEAEERRVQAWFARPLKDGAGS